MYRILLLWLLLGSLPGLSMAQCPGIVTTLVPFAEETLTIGATAQPLTASVYQPVGTPASLAVATVKGADISYFLVQTPTTGDGGLGHRLTGVPPQSFVICGLDSIKSFKAIRVTTNALLTLTYFRPKSP
jgi:hypothetical protein